MSLYFGKYPYLGGFKAGSKRQIVSTPEGVTFCGFKHHVSHGNVLNVVSRLKALTRDRPDMESCGLGGVVERYSSNQSGYDAIKRAIGRNMLAYTVHIQDPDDFSAPSVDSIIGVATVHPGNRLFYAGDKSHPARWVGENNYYNLVGYWLDRGAKESFHRVVASELTIGGLASNVLRNPGSTFGTIDQPDDYPPELNPQRGFRAVGGLVAVPNLSTGPNPSAQQIADGTASYPVTTIFVREELAKSIAA